MTGEFGRTPRVGEPIRGWRAKPDGRDHWPGVFSLLAFGAGICADTSWARSDRLASFPQSSAYSPADLAANVLSALGVDLAGTLTDALGQPFPVNTGTLIPWS